MSNQRQTELLGTFFPEKAVSVTPHDTNDNIYDWLYIGVTGDVTVVTKQGDTVTFVSAPVGPLYISTSKVKNTGTAADEIIGLRVK